MRRTTTAAALTAVLAAAGAAAAPAARADEEIVAAPPNRYATPTVTMDQGERLTFRNTDVVRHDVHATGTDEDGKPLFRTPVIGPNETAFVEGSQYLTTGSYGFFCTIHAYMRGTVRVTGQGTPVPRPGRTPPPAGSDTTPPSPAVTVLTRRLRDARRGIVVRVRLDEPGSARVTLTARRTAIASGLVRRDAAGTTRSTLRLTPAGARLVRRGRTVAVAVRVKARDRAGNVGRASARAVLRG